MVRYARNARTHHERPMANLYPQFLDRVHVNHTMQRGLMR